MRKLTSRHSEVRRRIVINYSNLLSSDEIIPTTLKQGQTRRRAFVCFHVDTAIGGVTLNLKPTQHTPEDEAAQDGRVLRRVVAAKLGHKGSLYVIGP